MALLAQGFDPNYIPDYGVVNRANEQFAQTRAGMWNDISKQVTDYAAEQKDLQKKDKEMGAKIKGAISLLDNAKALYPDFAQQMDSTKVQLSDPSLSTLDRFAIAGQVENSLNLIAARGTEATKTALQIAEMQQKERLAGVGTARAPRLQSKTMWSDALGQNVEGVLNLDTGEFTMVGEKPKSQVAPSEYELPTGDPSVPASQTSGGGQTGLGNPPMMAPTIEGASIPIDESQLIKTLDNGDELRVYQGKQYTVPSPSLLPPLDEASNIPATNIDNSLALTPNTPPAKQNVNAAAIESAANSAPSGTGYGPAREDPAKVAERVRRGRLEESQIAANNAAAAKAASETKAKEEKVIESQQATQAAAQNARGTVRSQIAEVNKYADQIGTGLLADIGKNVSKYSSHSAQARLIQAIKPISSAMIWDQMTKLRAASATGSTGLGSLTEGERKNLESTIVSLDALQDPRDIKRAMTKIEDYMRNAEFGNWHERKELVKQGKMSPVRFNEIEKGYSSPNMIPSTGALRTTPEQEALLKQFE